MEYPAVYRITVQGVLDDDWSDRLAGMSITPGEAEGKPIATLIGRLRDQAELSGVLNTLYEMHLSILGVERLVPDSSTSPSKEEMT
jgi:hypothetical protein